MDREVQRRCKIDKDECMVFTFVQIDSSVQLYVYCS